ncbi:MAG: hypothetical protein Q9159_001672 [Coniocarpon cinnabarinum]
MSFRLGRISKLCKRRSGKRPVNAASCDTSPAPGASTLPHINHSTPQPTEAPTLHQNELLSDPVMTEFSLKEENASIPAPHLEEGTPRTPRSNPDSNIWSQAYTTLLTREPDLVRQYHQILNREIYQSAQVTPEQDEYISVPTASEGGKLHDQTSESMIEMIEANIKKAEKKSKTTEYIDNVAEVLIPAKDFIFLNPTQQRSDLLEGLKKISGVLARYQLYEARITDGKFATALNEPARKQFVDRTRNIYGDTFRVDDWKKLLAWIEKEDTECERLLGALNNQFGYFTSEATLIKMEKLRDEIRHEFVSHSSAETRTCLEALYVDHESQKNRNPERVSGTCECSLSSPLLWISADPGCGKSVLSKTLIDEQLLGTDLATVKVCYFFFKDNAETNRSPIKALSSILHQLLVQDRSLMRHAMRRFDTEGKKFVDSFYTLRQILKDIMNDPEAGEVVILIDAFDECSAEGRRLWTEGLDFLLDEHSKNLKAIVTSRPYRNIHQGFHELRQERVLVEVAGQEYSKTIGHEITLVIEKRVEELADCKDLSIKVKKQLQESLLKVENKTYLWLYLILNHIESSGEIHTRTSIDKVLSGGLDSIDAAYENILEHSTNKVKAKKLLKVVVGAYRPLSWTELQLAMTIEDDPEQVDDLMSDTKFELIAREICGLFITAYEGRVFLLHQTAKEYVRPFFDFLADFIMHTDLRGRHKA